MVFSAFEEAVKELAPASGRETLRIRSVALRARELYLSLGNGASPSSETFRKLASGPRALPEVAALLEAAGIRSAKRTRLDRDRLRTVFQEAIQRFEARLFRNRPRPIQIARRAYDLYARTEADSGSPRPSPHTFQRLIYGKTADPEILEMIAAALKGRG